MATQAARKVTKPAVQRQRTAASNEPDAIALLTADHRLVKKLFADFGKLRKGEADSVATATLVGRICIELRLHTQLEEEIFYPVVRAAIQDNDLMDEADVEHDGVRDLIAQLEGMDPTDDHYNAKVMVLSENVDHHVKEEQEEMFKKAKKAKVNMSDLGRKLVQRRKELRSAMR